MKKRRKKWWRRKKIVFPPRDPRRITGDEITLITDERMEELEREYELHRWDKHWL